MSGNKIVNGLNQAIGYEQARAEFAARLAAAEAREARLVAAGQAAIAAVVWKDGYCPHCSTLPEHCHTHKPECPIGALARAALATDGSALAQAIEGVLDADRRERAIRGGDPDGHEDAVQAIDAALDTLRRAWGQR